MEMRPERAQGEVRLGREHQDEERVVKAEAPAEQAQADGHRDQGDRHRGQQLQHERGQEGQAEGPHGGDAVTRR